ncbi:phage tail tape measure protein [Mycobacteroides chelonae]|uniref:phage tail tape measure protein n=1 Tax=Mycobacteroides chelonae TaxID=1774 RepID=UPI0018B01E25|nr:phage tail tape measure protein [Mycobacteroides chelonae]MBF9316556.1 phage tail tape measure protein [Mycobacteroides chelonae]
MSVILPIEARPDNQSFKRAADQAVRIFGNAGGDSSAAFARQFTAGSSKMQSATRAYEKAYDSIADAAGKAKTAESQLQQQRDKAASLGEKIAADEKRLADARKSGDTNAAASAERSLTQAREQQARTNTQIVRTAENLNRSRREEVRNLKDAVSAYRQLQDSQGSRGQGVFSGITSQSSGIVGQFASIGSSAGKGFVAGAATAIVAGGLIQAGVKAAEMVLSGFKSVMDTGIDFSRSVNNFKGVTESNDAQTRQMATAARALGADTTMAGVSASDAARAMTELAKAGFTVDQAIGSARGTMQLATAAQVDAAQAAEIQANAMNAFGLKAADAAHIADVLANAANGSSADIAGIGLSLAQVGGVAAGFGQSIEETATAIAMLAKMGIKGSDAGTSLKTMLVQLRNPSDQSAQAMSELGLKVNDANGQLISMRELFRQLGDAKSRMPTDVFQQDLATLFGTDAIRAPLLGSVQVFDELYGVVNRTGTAAATARTQMEGWPGVVEGVKNSTEALKLSLFDVFNTPAGQNLGNKLVSGLDGMVQWVNTHQPEIIGFVTDFTSAMATGTDAFLGFTARILQAGSYLADALGIVFGNMGKAIGGVVQAIGSVSKHIPGMKATGEAMETAGGAVLKWSNVMTNAGSNMRSAADGIDHLREGVRGLRDGFTDSMREAQAQEEMYRRNGEAIKDLKGKIEELPDRPKDFVIKDNSDEVKNRLKALGVEAKQLPDGRMVVHLEYRDANTPAALTTPQQLGATGSALNAFGSPLGSVIATLGNLPPAPRVGVSNTPIKPKKGSGGDSNAYVDPSQFQVGGNPSFSTPSGVPGTGPTGLVDAQAVYEAESSVMRAKNNLEQDRLKVIQLEQKGNADQLELLRAKNQVQEDERAYTAAQMKLAEAQRGTVKKMRGFADEMGEIGAKLDADFGASKGLGGLAENLVKFVANLAFAPMMGQLSAIAAANPSKGGYGMMGILGARGAFGPQFTGVSDTFTGAQAIGPMALQPGMNPNLAAMYALAARGGKYAPASDLANGLADCSGAVSDLVEVIQNGVSSPARLFDTTAFATDASAAKLGFLPGYQPGAFNVGVNPLPGQQGHMAATLPNGMNFESGGGHGPMLGGAAAGALDKQFNKQYYMPVGGGTTAPSPVAPTTQYATPGVDNTNPGLTNPIPIGGGGGGPTGPMQSWSPSQTGTRIGGVTPASGSGKGGVAMTEGGTLDTAMSMAASGLDLLAPGAGQAAQTGMKLANRAIQYGGQVAGIGVQGLMDTFLPTGGSELANKSWITKIVGGIAGAAPALPNMAGKSTAPPAQQGSPGQNGETQAKGGNTYNTTINNSRDTGDGLMRDFEYHTQQQNQAPGM